MECESLFKVFAITLVSEVGGEHGYNIIQWWELIWVTD
jgi:hypothetical protein